MENSLKFAIDFYRIRNQADKSQELGIDEQFEAGERATFFIETLVYFITASSNDSFNKTDSESYLIYLANANELIDALLNSTRESLLKLDERRIELEKIVANLPKR